MGIVNGKSVEVQNLFSPGKIVAVTTDKITVEHGQTDYVLNSIQNAMAWSCSQEQEEFYNILLTLQKNLTTHLAKIQTMNEADVIARQTEILAGDYSFFYARSKIFEYNDAVNKYFPNGFCGVCLDEYKCGSNCCTDPGTVCCPAFSGSAFKTGYQCSKPGYSVCCTDEYLCKDSYKCFTNDQYGDADSKPACCGDGEIGCPMMNGDVICIGDDYPICCSLQGKSMTACSADYPYCGDDNMCHNSPQAMLQGSNGVPAKRLEPNNFAMRTMHNETSKKLVVRFV